MEMQNWNAVWIENTDCPGETAPIFIKEFTVGDVRQAELRICGLGFYVAELNGRRVGDAILAPAFTAYDKTALYNTYDVADLLRSGSNELRVTLGNGWYNQQEPDAWEFEHAAWRTRPQLICELWINGECAVQSDSSWTCGRSRYVYNSLRCGDTYDASAEISGLHPASVSHGPGGVLKLQTIAPIRLREVIDPVGIVPSGEPTVYDFGVNLAGNVEINVRGTRGSRVTIQYSERIGADGAIDRRDISPHVHTERFQEDQYVLSGVGEETWHSAFGYNGFRYARIFVTGEAEILRVQARCFHTDLADAGSFTIDHPAMNALQQALLRATRTNFHHIPTDCPHREKNGWTGDAHLSCEQALFNLDMTDAYLKWLDDIVDCQRTNGQVACIVPTSVWGYNWGTGTTWDIVLFEIPYQLYLFTGDESILERYILPMKQYLNFMRGTADHGIWRNGLGDWCPPKGAQTVSTPALLTAYAYRCVERYAHCAAILGDTAEAEEAEAWAAQIRADFQQEFIGKEPDSQAYLALLLAFGLTDDPADVLKRLETQLIADDFHPTSGIFGTKLLYNALTDAGRFDLAWKAATVTGAPGFTDMMTYCSGTLGESWTGEWSRNHHMFSSIGDWFYKGIAGIHLDEQAPGFRHIFLRPHVPAGCQAFGARHDTPLGALRVTWDGKALTVVLPPESTATVEFDGVRTEWAAGVHTLTPAAGRNL